MKSARGSSVVHSMLGIAALAGFAAAQDQTRRVSSNLAGGPGSKESLNAEISADGRFVAYTSWADDLVPNDTNSNIDVFVYDVVQGTTERVSVATDGTQGNYGGFTPAISADGRFVTFTSWSTNLVANDTNNQGDVFVRDRTAGTTSLVSVATSGAQANGECDAADISGDGTRIVFFTNASNLDPADTNGKWDIYVRDTVAGTTTLVSATQAGVVGDKDSLLGAISGDGRHVAFSAACTNFPNYTPSGGTYVKDLDTGNLERVDIDWSGGFPAKGAGCYGISNDGSIVLLVSWSPLVPEDTNNFVDIYVRDRTHGLTERVSLGTGGGQIMGGDGAGMSRDGRFIGFLSVGDDATSDDHNGLFDVILYDRTLKIATLVTKGTLDERITDDTEVLTNGDLWTGRWISDDGSQILFNSKTADLVAGDTTGLYDVFLRSLDRHPATSAHYGTGWPGTGGTTPTIDPQSPPYRGSTLDLAVTNSYGVATPAFAFIGLARGNLPTSLGGSLLVDWTEIITFALADGGATLTGGIPTSYLANGLAIDLQVLELDPGASRGVSFTDGLELVLGDS